MNAIEWVKVDWNLGWKESQVRTWAVILFIVAMFLLASWVAPTTGGPNMPTPTMP